MRNVSVHFQSEQSLRTLWLDATFLTESPASWQFEPKQHDPTVLVRLHLFSTTGKQLIYELTWRGVGGGGTGGVRVSTSRQKHPNNSRASAICQNSELTGTVSSSAYRLRFTHWLARIPSVFFFFFFSTS